MKRSITMGAFDKVKANKRATKASKSFARFFSVLPKERGKPIEDDLDLSGQPSSSAEVLATPSKIIPSNTNITAANTTTPTATATITKAPDLTSPPASTGVSGRKKKRVDGDGGAAHSSSDNNDAPRVKHVIIMNNKPVAMSMRTEKDPPAPEEVPMTKPAPFTKPALAALHKIKGRESMLMPEIPERKGIRTFRVWTPQHNKKSIPLLIGDHKSKEEADKVFHTSQIKSKSYEEWRKEAKALLPSNTGGAPIGRLSDALHAAPTLKRESNPRVIQQTIKRLSMDSDEVKASFPKEEKVKVDYTRFREIHWDQSVEDEEPKKRSNSDIALDLGDSDTDHEERMLEWERKQAGIDIKSKMYVVDETLKQMTEHLSEKRIVRQQLIGKATGGITVLDAEDIPIKEHLLYLAENLGDLLHDVFSYFVIWEKHIREINGRFGVVTANYFIWVRQMVGLELLAFFLTYKGIIYLFGFSCSIIIIPEMADPDNLPQPPRPDFQFSNLITGEGYFHQSYLYYTGYHSMTGDSANPLDNQAIRFLFCLLIMFFVLTYFIFSRLTRYYHTARMESTVSGVANMDNFKTIMCGWDFSCRDPKAKIFLHKTICRELKILARKTRQPETAVVQIDAEHKKVLAFMIKYLGVFWGPWAIHIAGTLMIVVACVILGVLLFHLCQLKLDYYLKCVSLRDDQIPRDLKDPVLCPDGDHYLSSLILSLPAVFSSMATLLLTKIILIVGDLESWDTPERKIYATMIRAGLFYFTNIGVFYTFWLVAKPELNREGFVAETIFGKELYRLVVIQGLIDVTLNLGVKGMYHLIRRKSKNYQKTEFRTEYYCLSMFFIHSVSRIGTLFCPPISIFVTLRLVVDFYQNRFSLFYLSCQESYSIHVSQVYAPFLLTFFILCYLITSFMTAYYISDTPPSNYDGPFQYYNESYDEVLGLLLSSGKKTRWIATLAQPGFLVTLLAILTAAFYFCYKWAKAYDPLVVQLNELISVERADRDLLLKAIFEIGQVTIDDVGDEEHPRLARMRRTGILAAGTGRSSGRSSGGDSEYGDETDDSHDQQIDALIHHVRRRKTAAANLRLSHGPLSSPSPLRDSTFSASRSAELQNMPVRRSTKKGVTLLTDIARQNHIDHMETIVANIVDARRRKSMAGYRPPPSALPHHDNTLATVAESTPLHINVGQHQPPAPEQHHHPPPRTSPHPRPPHAPGKVLSQFSHKFKDPKRENHNKQKAHAKNKDLQRGGYKRKK